MQFSHTANPVRTKSSVMLNTKSKSYLPPKHTPFAHKMQKLFSRKKGLSRLLLRGGCVRKEEWENKDPGLWFWKGLATPLYMVADCLSKSAIS